MRPLKIHLAGARLLVDSQSRPEHCSSRSVPGRLAHRAAESRRTSSRPISSLSRTATSITSPTRVKIAKRTGATVISNFEICEWLGQQGVKNTEPHEPRRRLQASPFGRVKLTMAHHSSVLPDGTPGGNPGGFCSRSGRQLYFACDTALFCDMKLIGARRTRPGRVPIGDRSRWGPTTPSRPSSC